MSLARKIRMAAAVLALLVPAFSARSQDAGDSGSGTEAERNVARLGAERFEDREDASRKLLGMGFSARSAVKAALDSKDPEVKARARRLWSELKWVVFPGADKGVAEFVSKFDRKNPATNDWDGFIKKYKAPSVFLIYELSKEDPAIARKAVESLLSQCGADDIALQMKDKAAGLPYKEFLSLLDMAGVETMGEVQVLKAIDVNVMFWDYGHALAACRKAWSASRNGKLLDKALKVIQLASADLPVWKFADSEFAGSKGADTDQMLLFYSEIAVRTSASAQFRDLIAARPEILKVHDMSCRKVLVENMMKMSIQDAALLLLDGEMDAEMTYLKVRLLKVTGDAEGADRLWQELEKLLVKEAEMFSVAERMKQYDDPRRIPLLEQILSTDPANSVYDSNACFRLAPEYEREGEFGKAADMYQRGLDMMSGMHGGCLILESPQGSKSGDAAVAYVKEMISALRRKAVDKDGK